VTRDAALVDVEVDWEWEGAGQGGVACMAGCVSTAVAPAVDGPMRIAGS
jgi:hypothetical protein